MGALDLTTGLADQLRPRVEIPPVVLRQAVVTAVAAGSCTITLGGTSIPGVKYHDGYLPQVSDTVVCLQSGADIFVFGKLASGDDRWDRKRRTAGNVSTSSTSYANFDTALDITLPAAAGDWFQLGVSCLWDAQLVLGDVDIATIVSGSPVNYCSGAGSGGFGIQGLVGMNLAGHKGSGATIMYQAVAGDISGGNIVFRVRWKVESASSKTMLCSSTRPCEFWAINRGPQP